MYKDGAENIKRLANLSKNTCRMSQISTNWNVNAILPSTNGQFLVLMQGKFWQILGIFDKILGIYGNILGRCDKILGRCEKSLEDVKNSLENVTKPLEDVLNKEEECARKTIYYSC